MANDPKTAEDLHSIASNVGSKQVGTPGFVNPGTPTSALVTDKDLPDATVSQKATDDLRTNLTK